MTLVHWLGTAEYVEGIQSLTFDDVFLPRELLMSKLVPSIVVTSLVLSAIYFGWFLFVDRIVPPGSSQFVRRKVCYQLTNFCTNCFLGLSGVYIQTSMLPNKVTVEEQIVGFNNLIPFSGFQLGYQLWAIPIGLFLINEDGAMLLHHFTVIFVASMSGTFTNGFRYWTPFFYGVIELSSVPLAIMNTFKDNPSWIKKQPLLYLIVRLIFAFSFVYVRLVLFVPRHVEYLRQHVILWSGHDNRLYQGFMAIVWLCSACLLTLQIYWGSLIIRGLVKVLLPGKKSKGKQNVEANGIKQA